MNDPNNPNASNDPNDLHRRCDAIEESYEFMLAYAAQGLSGDAASQSSGQLRDYLTRAVTALEKIGDVLRAAIERNRLEPADRYRTYADLLDRDARDAQASIELVLAQSSISSQLVDNLNASVHVRKMLTDLFLIDEILAPQVITSVGGSPSRAAPQ